MRTVYEYSHFGGAEILQVRCPDRLREIYDLIESVDSSRTKGSKHLYSAKSLSQQFRGGLRARGYEELRETFTIKLPNHGEAIKGAFKQVDFAKDRVLVEARFGDYASMFYDMVKFEHFVNENKADVGVEIVPCHSLHKQMSTGVSYGEQLVYDIERLKRHFPTVPVKVILIDV